MDTPTEFADLNELLGFLQESNFDVKTAAEHLRDCLGHRMKITHLIDEGDVVKGRLMLTSDRGRANPDTLDKQCGGVVLADNPWRILLMPPSLISQKYALKTIANNIKTYKIYEIMDGTIVTLYWYDGQWRLSSTNGPDVGEYLWIGPLTYMEAFKAAGAPAFETLDTNLSYTVGFRHHDFHPLVADPSKVWIIHVYDTVNRCFVAPDLAIPWQLPAKTPKANVVKWMQDKCLEALQKYNATGAIHYGFLLRGPFQDVIFESTLLKAVRQSMYNLPKKRHPGAKQITPANRMQYNTLRAYLGNNKGAFIKMFPQFASHYTHYDEVLGNLAKCVLTELGRPGDVDRATCPRLTKLAAGFATHIARQASVDDTHCAELVADFICQRQHLDIYHSLIFG